MHLHRLILSLCAVLLSVVLTPDSLAQSSKVSQFPIVHVVCFKFKATDTESDVKKVVAAFCRLSQTVKQVAAFEWGPYVSPC